MFNNIQTEKSDHQAHNSSELRTETSKFFQSAYEHLPSTKEVTRALSVAAEVICPPLMLVDHAPVGVMKAAAKGIEEEIKHHPLKLGVEVLAGMTGALSIELQSRAAKSIWQSAEAGLANHIGKEIGEAAGKRFTQDGMNDELSKWHPKPAGGIWQEVQYNRSF